MALRGIVNTLIGGRGRRAGGAGARPSGGLAGAGTAGAGTGTGARRTQDEAIGRGVRGLLSRLRR